MSRTDQHDPSIVRFLDPRRIREAHDHREGACDLVDIAEWVRLDPSWSDFRCRWDLRISEYYEHAACGCPMCTDQIGRKARARRERYEGKREARAMLAEWAFHAVD